jgi:hypothetical protein
MNKRFYIVNKILFFSFHDISLSENNVYLTHAVCRRAREEPKIL